MYHTGLKTKIQQLYYRLGGSSQTLGIIETEPIPIQTRHGKMMSVRMINRAYDSIDPTYRLFIPMDFYLKFHHMFEQGRDIAIRGALYPTYGIVWDAFNY